MASIKYYISRAVKSDNERTEIQLRFCGNRNFVKRALTGIFVTASNWDSEKGMPKDKRSTKFSDECVEIKERLECLSKYLLNCWNEADSESISDNALNQWISDIIWEKEEDSAFVNGKKKQVFVWRIESKAYREEVAIRQKKEMRKIENWYFLDCFKYFAQEQFENGKICKRRFDHYNSVYGLWDRMERFNGKRLKLKEIETEDMYSFRRFILNEHDLWENNNGKMVPMPKYRYVYDGYSTVLSRGVPERSLNYVNTEMKYLIAFWHWLLKKKECKLNDVFASYQRDTTVFGTPYFLNSEDRNLLFNADLSAKPALAIQRDIFVFQSLIGCRVSDLLRLKKSNIVDGEFLQYVAGKTKDKSGKTLNVPLHKDAKTILARYSDLAGEKLLPFISSQKYNEAIKEIFKAVPEVDRIVTVLNPLTRQEEQRYLHEVASSHMARRNFCGNLYEAGFADSDIGSMSGHSEKSREIARYRKVSVDRQVKMIDTL